MTEHQDPDPVQHLTQQPVNYDQQCLLGFSNWKHWSQDVKNNDSNSADALRVMVLNLFINLKDIFPLHSKVIVVP